MKTLLVFFACYLVGSVSGAYILSRAFFHKDIRDEGSGNAGTTNAVRVMGKKLGWTNPYGSSPPFSSFWATTFPFIWVFAAAKASPQPSAPIRRFSLYGEALRPLPASSQRSSRNT